MNLMYNNITLLLIHKIQLNALLLILKTTSIKQSSKHIRLSLPLKKIACPKACMMHEISPDVALTSAAAQKGFY